MNIAAGKIMAAGGAEDVFPADLIAHTPRSRNFALNCPHCSAPGIIRSSVLVEVTFRVVYFGCFNFFCGHTWRASLAYEYGIIASAIPNPAVNLPLRTVQRSAVIDDALKRNPDPNQPELFG